MNKLELQKRTKRFHLAIINVAEIFPKTVAGLETIKQLIRSAGSVGANYRAACKAKSKKDFAYKLSVVMEEADESQYWLDVTTEALLPGNPVVSGLLKEATEIVAIFTAAEKTTRLREAPKIKEK